MINCRILKNRKYDVNKDNRVSCKKIDLKNLKKWLNSENYSVFVKDEYIKDCDKYFVLFLEYYLKLEHEIVKNVRIEQLKDCDDVIREDRDKFYEKYIEFNTNNGGKDVYDEFNFHRKITECPCIYDSRHESLLNGKKRRTTYRNFSKKELEKWLSQFTTL